MKWSSSNYNYGTLCQDLVDLAELVLDWSVTLFTGSLCSWQSWCRAVHANVGRKEALQVFTRRASPSLTTIMPMWYLQHVFTISHNCIDCSNSLSGTFQIQFLTGKMWMWAMSSGHLSQWSLKTNHVSPFLSRLSSFNCDCKKSHSKGAFAEDTK